MLTKAYIVEKIGNKYKVRIPILEDTGFSSPDIENTTDIPLYEATLSYTPGNVDSYVVGDVVFVQFEDNDMSKVVITGKLYQGEEAGATGYNNTQALNVSDVAHLTNNTYIGNTKIGDMFVTKTDFSDYESKMANGVTYRVKTVD